MEVVCVCDETVKLVDLALHIYGHIIGEKGWKCRDCPLTGSSSFIFAHCLTKKHQVGDYLAPSHQEFLNFANEIFNNQASASDGVLESASPELSAVIDIDVDPIFTAGPAALNITDFPVKLQDFHGTKVLPADAVPAQFATLHMYTQQHAPMGDANILVAHGSPWSMQSTASYPNPLAKATTTAPAEIPTSPSPASETLAAKSAEKPSCSKVASVKTASAKAGANEVPLPPAAIPLTQIPVDGELSKWARDFIGKLSPKEVLTLDWRQPVTACPDDICNTDCIGEL